jgi:hypothetical protein
VSVWAAFHDLRQWFACENFPQLAVHFNNQYWGGGLFRGLWWAQDGAPAHRASKGPPERGLTGITALPNEVHDVEQVATSRSLDLTPCGFFMWGYLKDKVFSTSPQNMEDLRQKIIEQFNALREQPDVTRKAVRDVHKRTV